MIVCCSCDDHYAGDARKCLLSRKPAEMSERDCVGVCSCECHQATHVAVELPRHELPLADECLRLRAALEMIAQVRHVSGSAQGAFRANLRIADAALSGADLRDLETVIAVAEGRWKA